MFSFCVSMVGRSLFYFIVWEIGLGSDGFVKGYFILVFYIMVVFWVCKMF